MNTREPSPLTTPPPGSRLEFLAAQFRPGPGDDETLWQALDYEGRRLSVALRLQEDPRIWKLPLNHYRDYVLVPGLEHLGMPPGPRPGWLDQIIDDLALCLQDRDRIASPEKPPKIGRPKSDEDLKTLVLGAFTLMQVRAPGASDKALFAKTEAYLGPGVLADVVRRVVIGARRATQGRKLNRVMLDIAGLGVANLLDEFERDRPWRARRRAHYRSRENA